MAHGRWSQEAFTPHLIPENNRRVLIRSDPATPQAGQNPGTATAEMAAAGEVAYPGGEEAFVAAIIRDSLVLKERVSKEIVVDLYGRGLT